MDNQIQGHLLKYKTETGEWVPIPILLATMYQMYVMYCTEHNITAVPETTYYETIGNLNSLVERLENSAGNINTLAEALDGGVLPLALGGTGIEITHGSLADYLFAAELNGGLNLATKGYAAAEAADVEHRLDTSKLDKATIAYGTEHPDDRTDLDDATIYFQYK